MVVGLVGVKLLLVRVDRVGMSKKAMCRRNRCLFGDARTDLISTFFENEIYDMIGFPNVLRTPRNFFYYFSSFKRRSYNSAQKFRAALYERPAADPFST